MATTRKPLLKKRPIRNFSASQLNAFRGCPRSWFLRWITGIKQPDTPAQARGKQVHSILEEYFKTKVIPQTHPLGYYRYIEWLRDAKLIPDPNEERIASEHFIFLDTATGLPIEGYNDAIGVPLVGVVDAGLYERELLEIGDLKTTIDLRYAKTPAELFADTQMNTYALWAFGHDDDLEEVKVTHYYVKVDPPGKPAVKKPKSTKVLKVSTGITHESAADIWVRDCATMEEMKTAYLVDSFEDLTPNLNFCDTYGGCSQKETCGIKPSLTLFARIDKQTKEKKKMAEGFMSKVNAARKAQGKGEAGASKDNDEKKSKVAKAAEAAEAKEAKAQAAKDKKAKAKEAKAAKEKESKKDLGKKPTFAEKMRAKKAAAAAAAGDPGEDEDEASITPPDGADRETSAEESEAIRGKASAAADKKAKAKAAKEEKAAKAKAAKEAKAADKKTTKSKTKAKGGFNLYIGCVPMKGDDLPYVLIEDWMAPILESLNENVSANTEHVHYRLLEFSEEGVALEAAVLDFIDENGLTGSLVCLDNGVSKKVATILVPLAANVTKALLW